MERKGDSHIAASGSEDVGAPSDWGCAVEQASKFERAIDAAERSGPPEDAYPRVHRAMIDAMRSELAELRHQIDALRDP
jgi:hypothetical protein